MDLNIHAGHNPDDKSACGAIGLIKESTENRNVKNDLIDILKDKKTLIREIHKKYVNPEIRRYVYEKLEF